MGSTWRVLFIWLLVLVVPVQGLAAALVLPCGAHHQAGGTAVVLRLQADHVAMPDRWLGTASAVHAGLGTGAAPCPHHAPPAGAIAGEEAATSTADPAAPTQGGHTRGACAAGCSVGALQSMVLAVSAATCPATAFAAVQATVSGCAADALERPPRAPPA